MLICDDPPQLRQADKKTWQMDGHRRHELQTWDDPEVCPGHPTNVHDANTELVAHAAGSKLRQVRVVSAPTNSLGNAPK